MIKSEKCVLSNCNKPKHTKGYCNGHYKKLWRWGDPLKVWNRKIPHLKRRIPVETRIWKKIIKTASGCWIWQGCVNKMGYGEIWEDGKRTSTHRVAYKITKGEIPKGQSVCHRCDNPPCINPDHLFLGTQSDNAKDMVKKGRNNTKGLEIGWKLRKYPINAHCNKCEEPIHSRWLCISHYNQWRWSTRTLPHADL